MYGLRLFFILGFVMIVNVNQICSETSDEDEEFIGFSSSEDGTDKGIEYYLNAIKGLHQEQKRQEIEPLVASRKSKSTPMAALHRRSALNKNFIRFGRNGMMNTAGRQLQLTTPIRLIESKESDGKDEEDQSARTARSLKSNFIRFGRSFFPSAARRSARASIARRRMMSLVDMPTLSSRR